MARQPLPRLALSVLLIGASAALVGVGIISLTTDARSQRGDASKEPVTIPAMPPIETPPDVGTDAYTRPMFHRDRAPGPDKAPPQSATDPSNPSDPTSTGNAPDAAADASNLVVKGIIIGENGARAGLQNPGDATLTWVRAGETIQGWKVESINASRVRISNGDDVVEIKVREDK
jgi:hypothetical protein